MKTSFKFLMALFIAVSLLACNKENPSGSDTPQPEPPQPKEYNRQTDSLALVAIYNASDGANWGNVDKRWDLSKPMTEWQGVTMMENASSEADRRVIGVKFTADLQAPNEWSLPEAVGDLKEVIDFRFSKQSNLTGPIPASLCSLPKLQKLYFQNSNLSGSIPADLGNLTALMELYLNGNPNLKGTIPASIGSLTNLQKFNISNTKVGGALPAAMENCTKLSDLYTTSTQITSIAIDWSKFTALANLNVASTATLEEPLPVSLGNMTTTANTLNITMNSCNFTGNVPESWGNLPAVTNTLKIFGNKLAGVLPNAFTEHPKYAAKWNAATNILPQQEGYGLTKHTDNPPPWSDDLN